MLFFIPVISIQVFGQVSLNDFNPQINGGSYYSVTQPDGKLIVAGNFGEEGQPGVFRLNPNGSIDSKFSLSIAGNSHVLALASLPDGKLLISVFSQLQGNSRSYLIRINADGTPDKTFNDFIRDNGYIVSILTQPDGKIIIGGNNLIFGQLQKNLVRLNSDGSLDTTFTPPDFDLEVYSASLLDDGKILVAGDFETVNGLPRSSLVRLNSNGTLDESFQPMPFNSNSPFIATAVSQPDGKILIGGVFFIGNPNIIKQTFTRLNSDGSLDESYPEMRFFGSSTSYILSSALQSDGKIIIGGNINGIFISANNIYSIPDIARINSNGSLDITFSNYPSLIINGASPPLQSLYLQNNGKILLSGNFWEVNSQPRRGIALLNNDTPAIDYLSATSSEIRWTRGGSTPMLERAEFEFSTDGVNYTSLGAGKRESSNWILNNLKLPIGQNISIRARGVHRTGFFNGSQSIIETKRNVFFTTPTAIKTRFDFDGDGKADVSVVRPNEGNWYLQQSQNGFAGITFGSADDLIVPADFDGDGKTDISVFRPLSGTWYYLRSSDNGFVAVRFGQNGDLPRPADFDGDGKADISVFRPSNGAWYHLNSSNGSFFGTIFGQNGDKPLVADFDGDGKSDLAVFRPSTASFYWTNSSTGAFNEAQFGLSTDIPTPGDFDGDGRTELSVFRPSNGTWYRYNPATGAFFGVQFGASGDIPVAADYDGDGKTDVAVFRPSNGNWYYQNSSNGGFVGINFGISTDKPVPAAFIQ